MSASNLGSSTPGTTWCCGIFLSRPKWVSWYCDMARHTTPLQTSIQDHRRNSMWIFIKQTRRLSSRTQYPRSNIDHPPFKAFFQVHLLHDRMQMAWREIQIWAIYCYTHLRDYAGLLLASALPLRRWCLRSFRSTIESWLRSSVRLTRCELTIMSGTRASFDRAISTAKTPCDQLWLAWKEKHQSWVVEGAKVVDVQCSELIMIFRISRKALHDRNWWTDYLTSN